MAVAVVAAALAEEVTDHERSLEIGLARKS